MPRTVMDAGNPSNFNRELVDEPKSAAIYGTISLRQFEMLRLCRSLIDVDLSNVQNKLIGKSVSGEDYSFSGMTSLQRISLPYGVTNIADKAFYGCNALISVNIPSSVTYIGNKAFANCSSLGSVCIPFSVKKFGGDIFSGCSKLKSIYVDCKLRHHITCLRDSFRLQDPLIYTKLHTCCCGAQTCPKNINFSEQHICRVCPECNSSVCDCFFVKHKCELRKKVEKSVYDIGICPRLARASSGVHTGKRTSVLEEDSNDYNVNNNDVVDGNLYSETTFDRECGPKSLSICRNSKNGLSRPLIARPAEITLSTMFLEPSQIVVKNDENSGDKDLGLWPTYKACIICSWCAEDISNLLDVTEHRKECRALYFCESCNVYVSADQKLAHFASFHSKISSQSDERLLDKSGLQSHKNESPKHAKIIKCKCGLEHYEHEEEKHLSECHSLLRCDYCNEDIEKYQYDDHIAAELEMVKCPSCDEYFERHKATQHEKNCKRLLKCTGCAYLLPTQNITQGDVQCLMSLHQKYFCSNLAQNNNALAAIDSESPDGAAQRSEKYEYEYCPFQKDGCNFRFLPPDVSTQDFCLKLARQKIAEHLLNDCLFMLVPCPNAARGCKEFVIRANLRSHLQQCAFCEKELCIHCKKHYKDVIDHIKYECTSIHCMNGHFGCNFSSFDLGRLVDHESHCNYTSRFSDDSEEVPVDVLLCRHHIR